MISSSNGSCGRARNRSVTHISTGPAKPREMPAKLPTRMPMRLADQHRGDADRERDAAAGDHPGQQILPEIVGAERMGGGRTLGAWRRNRYRRSRRARARGRARRRAPGPRGRRRSRAPDDGAGTVATSRSPPGRGSPSGRHSGRGSRRQRRIGRRDGGGCRRPRRASRCWRARGRAPRRRDRRPSSGRRARRIDRAPEPPPPPRRRQPKEMRGSSQP